MRLKSQSGSKGRPGKVVPKTFKSSKIHQPKPGLNVVYKWAIKKYFWNFEFLTTIQRKTVHMLMHGLYVRPNSIVSIFISGTTQNIFFSEPTLLGPESLCR